MENIEYQVRLVTRYIVTRFESSNSEGGAGHCGSAVKGEYENADVAYEVAYALAKADQERLNIPCDDMRVIFPKHPNTADVSRIG